MTETSVYPPTPKTPAGDMNTNNTNATPLDRSAEASDRESQTEKKTSPRKPGLFSRARALGPVTKDHGDIPLLVCCFVTGMVDAACFRNYGMFIGMQTGNTVILGLSASGLPENPYAWLTTLVSIASFLVGAFLTFRVSNYLYPKGCTSNRLWTTTLFLIQALFLFLAAGLATPAKLIPHNPSPSTFHTVDPHYVLTNIKLVALIPPLAFQSGMQIAVSRLLGFNELPVNVVTSTYCDIMGDMKLLATNNVKRNRRVLAVLLLLVGAIASGWLLRSSGGLMAVLWLSGGMKSVTALACFFFLPAAKQI